MIKTILIWLGIVIAITFAALWLFSGGVGKIIEQAKLFGNPLKDGFSSGTSFKLPWQPEVFSDLPSVPGVPSSSTGTSKEDSETSAEKLRELEEEYERLEAARREGKEFGTPSPYRGDVTLQKSNATKTSVQEEYVVLSASSDNTTPVDITGWSIQSALTGVRAYIPRGANDFYMGTVTIQENIQLSAGGSAMVLSGQSPVGTSFRENMCIGYLNQLQTFYPVLKERCPASADALPLTADNLRDYGDACVDFVKTVPKCRAPMQSFTSDLSPACRVHLSNVLSYNGCVSRYQYRSDFRDRTWRVYLNAPRELWRNTHDVIRLLDAEGRTVDAITY